MGLRHLAVIMDGNGRWAKKHHLPRLAGHRAGAESLDRTMHWCKEAGISYLTVYAFSTENWKRSKGEVAGLMKLLSHFIKAKEKELIKNGSFASSDGARIFRQSFRRRLPRWRRRRRAGISRSSSRFHTAGETRSSGRLRILTQRRRGAESMESLLRMKRCSPPASIPLGFPILT